MGIRPLWRIGAAALCLAAVTLTSGAASAAPDVPAPGAPKLSAGPVIFGHRGGATGYRPEHTTEDIVLGAQMGADYIEPDLVPTKDGYLVDRHEPDISQTTDVADHPEFASRKATKVIDGQSVTGWFTTDFTLAELKTLRCIERLPDIRQHNTLYNGRDTILTFQEEIDLVRSLALTLHRHIGIVPEIKHSTYFDSMFGPNAMEQKLLDALQANGLKWPNPFMPVVIQSFEVSNLIWLHQRTSQPLMQLTSASGAPADLVAAGDPRTYADITSAAGLKQVATYAKWLGPDKKQIVPWDSADNVLPATSLVKDAHAAGLLVGPYTFRNENTFLPANYRRGANPADYGDAFAEYKLFYGLGVDGLFSDNADTAVAARQDWINAGRPAA